MHHHLRPLREQCLCSLCCPVTKSRLTLCNPMDCSATGFPVSHCLQSLLKLMSVESVIPSNHLILSLSPCPQSSVSPLSSCSQSFPASVSFPASRDLDPRPGIEPGTTAVKALSPNHWTLWKSLAYSLKQGSAALSSALLRDREGGSWD